LVVAADSSGKGMKSLQRSIKNCVSFIAGFYYMFVSTNFNTLPPMCAIMSLYHCLSDMGLKVLLVVYCDLFFLLSFCTFLYRFFHVLLFLGQL
jgi:hypothetical protein